MACFSECRASPNSVLKHKPSREHKMIACRKNYVTNGYRERKRRRTYNPIARNEPYRELELKERKSRKNNRPSAYDLPKNWHLSGGGSI